MMNRAEFRTNEALCLLSCEVPYVGPERGRPSRPTKAVSQAYIHREFRSS